jgi:LysR family pca operon transcriptional activator
MGPALHPGVKLRHLRLFLEIVAAGGLTAAARRQGVSQPAASRSLAELETLLGRPLFDRAGRELRLTHAGARFLAHARQALEALETGAASLAASAAKARLRVGALPTAMTRLFPAAALRFHAARPDVTISVVSGAYDHMLALLRERRVEAMIGRMPAPGEMADLRFDHLYDDPVVLVARAGHPRAGATLADVLAGSPLIAPPEGAAIRAMIDAHLARLGLAVTPAFETATLTLGRALLRGSDAVWFISRAVVADDLDAGDLIEIPNGAAALSGAIGATRRACGPLSRELDLLCDLLREEAQAAAAASRWRPDANGAKLPP